MNQQERIDSFDWSRTSIGPRESWPQSLRTSLSICLASRFPIVIWWGPDLIKLYNDAYAPILGAKHPSALGARGRDVWPHIWPIIGPMLEQVSNEGTATWSADQLLMMDRHGYEEEAYFTFSYSPIIDESGGGGGIFTAVFETTSRVIGERRLDTLRQLASAAGLANDVEEACSRAAVILGDNAKDVPAAAIYLRRGDRAERVCTSGAPLFETPDSFDWSAPLDLASSRVVRLPLNPGDERASGLLIAAASPYRALDDEYRGFFELVAGHISKAIADARAYELERHRAEALAELDRAKTAFFSNVSHEFRTPLTLMLGPIEELLNTRSLPADVREPLDLAHRNALRLLKLVNTLLDFSRIEAGRVDATYEPVDFSAVTADLAGVFRSAIETAGLKFVVDCPPLAEPVFLDRELWEKVVLNLVSNAFKFTFDGEVAVETRVEGDEAVLRVRDTGTGIPAAELEHVFERFHRVREARGRTLEGSGIGLALVQEVVRLHGGRVEVVSEPGSGSTFTVAVPLGSAHLPAERIGASRHLVSTAIGRAAYVEEALRWLPEGETTPATTDDSMLPVAAAGPRAHILVADDNADMRQYLRRLLSPAHEVEEVSDGAAALEAVRRRRPDLVISDVMMPSVDGFELLRLLRAGEETRDIPVLLLSARAGEESRVEGLRAGADDYLVKPFSAKELLAHVDAHLRLQRVRRDAQRALAASEAKFSTAFGRSPLALTITSLDDGRLIEVNDGFVRLSGYSREEAVGRTPDELGLWIDPQLRARALERFRAGEPAPEMEARFRVKSGEERIGVVGAAMVEIDGRPCILSSVTDITERKHADEAKDQFLATLSHELRTPLTSAFGWVKLLARARDPELIGSGIAAIEQSLLNQIKLIDDLLDVSRITAGKLSLDLQPIDLRSVVDDAVEMIRPAATARQLDLEVGGSALLPIRGDASRLKQVFWNLLSNAIKFTPAGRVEVQLRRDESMAEVVVRDTGEGIEAKFLPHVFGRFRQADATLTRRHGGLGIGLSIVASLVEAHGGLVKAESEGPGQGATFTVRLPLAEQMTVSAPSSRRAPSVSDILAGARIVVVDDDEGARRVMAAALEAAGATVRDAASAAEAFTLVGTWRPHVLVSDLAMPGEDGYSLVRRVREAGETIPAIAITAYVRNEDEARVRSSGFQRHLAKPFDPQDLVSVVDELRRS